MTPNWLNDVLTSIGKSKILIRMMPRWARILHVLLQNVENGTTLDYMDLSNEERQSIKAYLNAFNTAKTIPIDWIMDLSYSLREVEANGKIILMKGANMKLALDILENTRPNENIQLIIE